MRAYNLAMVMIFINCGFAVAASINVFDINAPDADGLLDLVTSDTDIEFLGQRISFSNITAFAVALVIGSLLIVNTKVGPSSSGIAYAIFTIVFWGGILSTNAILITTTSIDGVPIPGFEIFIAVFDLAAMLIFVNALVQMPTGGQRSHV